MGWSLAAACALLVGCGVVYWWIEPRTPTFVDGLWLAFVTASTIGYGDVVPTTHASRIFSVFVVLLGFAVLANHFERSNLPEKIAQVLPPGQ